MKSVRFFGAIIFVFVGILLASCVSRGAVKANSTAEIQSIQQKYAGRFERTYLTMDLSEFRQIWPEAVKSTETLEFTIYEFRETSLYYTDDDLNTGFWWTGSVRNHEFIQRELFYFTANKLVKYEYISGTSGLNN
jgi:hypothetical protein